MRKIIALLALLALAGCVSFPEESAPKEDSIYEASAPVVSAPEPKPAETPSEPNPLAPLPEEPKPSAPAIKPKAIVVNATNTTQPASNTTKTVQKGWTTESLSIAEGETKYIYIKQ
jgi:hypothetical protein